LRTRSNGTQGLRTNRAAEPTAPDSHASVVNARDRRLEGDELSRLIEALNQTPVVKTLMQLAVEPSCRRSELQVSALMRRNTQSSLAAPWGPSRLPGDWTQTKRAGLLNRAVERRRHS